MAIEQRDEGTGSAGVPRGIPASGAGPLADLLASDPPPTRRSAAGDILDQQLAVPRRHVTRTAVWVEDPASFDGGRWELVDDGLGTPR